MMSKRYEGRAGWSDRVDYQPAAEGDDTLDGWLMTAPGWHPVWSQFYLIVVRLRDDVPGLPPPVRRFPSATHELMVFALRPDVAPGHAEGTILPEGALRSLLAPGEPAYKPGTWPDAASFLKFCMEQGVPYLEPVNIVEQFEATDAEMTDLARWIAKGVADGILCPETADAPERVRAGWRKALTETLEHVRTGGHHGDQHPGR